MNSVTLAILLLAGQVLVEGAKDQEAFVFRFTSWPPIASAEKVKLEEMQKLLRTSGSTMQAKLVGNSLLECIVRVERGRTSDVFEVTPIDDGRRKAMQTAAKDFPELFVGFADGHAYILGPPDRVKALKARLHGMGKRERAPRRYRRG
jgi:hypothetical protein